MKARINRVPPVFKHASGMLELNLSGLVLKHPYMKTTLCNIVGVKSDRIDFTDKKYIVRMIIDKGEILEAEIGYPEDEWHIQKAEDKN